MTTASDTRGKWILVDYLNKDQSGLLSIGDASFHGASVRKNLDASGRELLADRIRVVADTSIGIDEVVVRRDERCRAVVVPILSPASNKLIAVRAVHILADQELPDKPAVGALEWLIWDDGRIETVWDDAMFDLYGISRSGSSSPTGDMNQWVNSLIAPEDRARMKLTIDAGIKEANGNRYFVHYRILTGFGTADRGIKNLEVASSCNQHPGLPLRRLCGIVREVPDLIPAINPEFGDTGSLMRAVFELSTEVVLAAVDVRRWQTFMTSNSWDAFGLQSPQYGYLPHIIHPDDFDSFREAVQGEGRESAVVRLLHKSGGYFPYEITASSGPTAPGDAEYVICKMKSLTEVS